jgi:1,5-anhydro-D-fructose reductase (1,5-anhydro-D-mannitol-forming)
LGPIVAASGQASNQLGAYAAEDSVAMSFTFGSGLIGTGQWQFGSFRHHDSVEIVGERGRLSSATFGDGPVTLETSAGAETFSLINPPHIQQPLIETVVAELRGERGACPADAESGARTAWVMDQVLGNYRQAKPSG